MCNKLLQARKYDQQQKIINKVILFKQFIHIIYTTLKTVNHLEIGFDFNVNQKLMSFKPSLSEVSSLDLSVSKSLLVEVVIEEEESEVDSGSLSTSGSLHLPQHPSWQGFILGEDEQKISLWQQQWSKFFTFFHKNLRMVET